MTDTTKKASAWSVTINNPTAADEEEINLARQKGWKVEGQLERGVEGTPHYQLLVKTPQVRFSAVKKAFTRAHIEAAKNVAALEKYVTKEETREGELPTQQEQYPSLSRFWVLIHAELSAAGLIHVPHGYTRVHWTPAADPDELLEFDRACEQLIYKGYRVESLAVNPANRSAFKKFSCALMSRVVSEAEKETQTSSQPDTRSNEEEENGEE